MSALLGRAAKRIHSYCTWRQCYEKSGRGRNAGSQYAAKRDQRQREKRVTQKWLDEYENREPIFCPWTYFDDPDEVGFAACNC